MNFILDNFTIILGYLFGAGGVSAFFFERRKNKAVTKGVEAEVTTKELNNSGKVVDLYKAALDDLELRYEKKYQEITALYERKIKVLESEIKLHKRIISDLKKENLELRRKLKDASNSDR
jgi:hypothetical protein